MTDHPDDPGNRPDARAQGPEDDDGELLRGVAAAMRRLGRHASMAHIARAAGLDPRDLYRRFPTPDALLRALASAYYDRLLAHAEQARQLPPERRLAYFLRTVGLHLATSHSILPQPFGELASPAQRERVYALTTELLATAREAGAVPDDVALADIATVIWGLRGVIATTDGVAPDTWERYLDIALAGLENPRLTFTRPPMDAEGLDAVIRKRREESR
ncbi:TetR family transcriptional regulator [Streptomyces fumigatiscleroticus]|nr:TetR family transcriptional regulator [Streptomyces fumigatiscleroticus]